MLLKSDVPPFLSVKPDFAPSLMLFSDGQHKNMLSMSVTFSVARLDRSSDVRLEQPLNMLCMDVTFFVSSFDRSSDASALQPKNM